MTRRGVPGAGWPWFVAWVLVGALWALAVLGALTIGVFVLPVAVAATILLVARPAARAGALGLLSGCGLPLLYVAYLNRDGPGTVCTVTATSSSCADEWSPWPFLALGAGLVILGVVLFARTRSDFAGPASGPAT